MIQMLFNIIYLKMHIDIEVFIKYREKNSAVFHCY